MKQTTMRELKFDTVVKPSSVDAQLSFNLSCEKESTSRPQSATRDTLVPNMASVDIEKDLMDSFSMDTMPKIMDEVCACNNDDEGNTM